MIERKFIANRTSAAFLRDNTSIVKLLFGCVGSGKSSTCDVSIMLMAKNMPPGNDGIRRSRWAVIRSTYSQLKTTTIKTWAEWFPPTVFGAIKGDSPMVHHIIQDDVDLEVIFLALDSMVDLQRLKSLELTGAYINEAQFVADPEILSTVLERTNRYPGKIFGGGLKRPLVIMDCNPPTTRHWIYKKFEIERPEGFKIYKMPPAIIQDVDGRWINNPDADFISQHEDHEYWLKLSKGASEEYIRVSLCGEYGVVEDGKAVHPEYNDRLHYADRKLNANDRCEIGLGWDFGLTPACAIVQVLPEGQLVILDELWTERMALREFAESIVIPHLDRYYTSWRSNYASRHDPAGGQGSQTDGRSCQDILMELGILSVPAQSNSREFRGDALKYFLTRMSGGQPGLLLSNNCQMLREGLMGKFKYEPVRSTMLSGDTLYHEKPLKNMHSHICEALEYIATHYARTAKEPKTTAFKPYNLYHGSFMGM